MLKTPKPAWPEIAANGKMVKPAWGRVNVKTRSAENGTKYKMAKPPCALKW